MNRRNCVNCQVAWHSVADEELEAPHSCPRCGDELGPVSQPQTEAHEDVALALAA